MSAHNNLNTNDIIFVSRKREMVSFELGEEIGKDAFRLLTSVEQRKTSESARGIEPHIFGFHLRASEHEIPWSGVRFLMETQDLFFFHARDKTNNVFLDITFTMKTGNANGRQGLHIDVTK